MNTKILWIQKESALNLECIRLFQEHGWEVASISSGALGVEKAQSFEPHLILVGEDISDFDALTVIKNIKSVPNKTVCPIILMGSEALGKKIEKEEEKWKPLIQFFMVSPIKADELVRMCEKILGKEPVILSSAKDLGPEILRASGPQNDGGAPPNDGDMKTLKEYLALKEKELSDFEKDFSRAKEQLSIAEKKASETEYEHKKMVEQHQDLLKRIELLTAENEELRDRYGKEIKSREQELQTKTDKLLAQERKLDQANKKYEELKERVKRDIQHIRVREKELEAKLEILKKDSETLLMTKDKKLLEFKRKMDSLEYEIENIREKALHSEKKVQLWKERIERVLRALKLGTSLLESEDLEGALEEAQEEAQEESAAQDSEKPTQKSQKIA
ncbi:MAG: hypothetical protein A2Z91_03585 [Deltaproteobacteria bacterium GWA2_38_16]|nr:MAG: hypothetical protein A2Z91_03585 [Deltaproteobacteria bacterium GWA2_38_16]OGQ02309.1 MAG: hypothetical protein A3D19_05760 [Deltaproteobacteria bacterium RIFCSPHIGHO2_02_FULL_38_15]OGQ30444.1 MAG: hypothetical protein A3A72_02590 [Deltaproteobacteria bacterium RIFCSPLOWO2_01_FULL_38_9]OGQ60291.1 MAG: hypothetical protein A3G92_05135 [Deltaproteobacteria bacterium RIFCSPLOWO2_12_FULL_38_8]HBQ22077.1 hypothetical protein [Deltaproteobacteria bacterium]